MHIQTVIIEGFRTYRNKTVLTLKPGLNVIVGRNGAGKTNVLCAIQFVLSHEFHHLSRRARENLLHSSAGFRATSAYVEITFNNKDRRLPEEGNEVSLRREITSTKDVYSLNGKTIFKQQVENTLQSAGFSKVNPYYIIKQGQINSLAMSSNAKRLTQMTEIAGSQLWEELRPEYDSLLRDAQHQITELEDLITETEEKLTSLEEDKLQYQNWSELNTRKRAIEATLATKEQARLAEGLRNAMKLLSKVQTEEQSARAEMAQRNEKVAEAERRNRVYQSEFRAAEGKLKYRTEIAQDLALEHSKLELELADKREKSMNNSVETLHEQLSHIEGKIYEENKVLSVVRTDYDSTMREEFEINARMMLNEQRRQQLFAKLGREALFSSIEERNQWIKEEQCKLNQLILQEEKELNGITEDLKEEELKGKKLENVITAIEVENVEALDSLKILYQRKQDLLMEQRRLRMSRNELWRRECDVRDHWKESHEKLENLKYKLRGSMQEQTTAFVGVGSQLSKMKQEGQGSYAFKMASQYCGLLIDQFKCAPEMSCAIDAVAGNRLFHSVVDTDEAATQILKRINKEPYQDGIGLPGTYSFYSLNRIKRAHPMCHIRDEESAMPMMSLLDCVAGMKPVVALVFGRVLICLTFDIALRAAKKYGLDCVTLEGDMVRHTGVLNGGYRNINSSRSKIYFDLKQAKAVDETELAYLHDVEEQIRVADSKSNDIASELQRVETKLSQTKVELLEADLKKHRGALSVSRQAIESKLAITRKLMVSLEANRAKVEMLEDELQQDFESELGLDDRSEVDRLNQEIRSAKEKLPNVNAARLELEGRKNALESRLNDHLVRTKKDLEQMIHEKSVSGLNQTVANLQAITDMEEHLKKLESNMKKNQDEITIVEDRIAGLSKAVAETKTELDATKNRQLEQETEVDRSLYATNKMLESIKRKEAAVRVISSTLVNLGPFTGENIEETIEQYAQSSVIVLERELTLIKNQLKGLEGVNQKAEVAYTYTQEKLIAMKEKRVHFNNSHRECLELVQNVEDRKSSAIQHSLMQVAREFRQMFKTMVPRPGIGYLRWTYSSNVGDSDDEDENVPQIAPDVERITGIAVKVSFSSTTNVRDLNGLSGGQRAVVSLALIFAILMMDRAPFYLLDEADVALDANYRSKVAAMVGKFSQKSQFIAITFRPELLEHADNIIGVSFDAATQISRVRSITKQEADDFISSHGSASSNSNRSPSSGASLQ